jgi:uncharacterized protein (TIGR04222 family)
VGNGGEHDRLLVTEVAGLAGGSWAATRTGLAMLHARGLLDTDQHGRVQRVGSSPRTGEPLEKALFAGLLGAMGARELAEKPRVRVALRAVRVRLEECGLVRRGWVRLLVPLALLAVPGIVCARLVAAEAIDPTTGVFVALAGVVAAGWFLPRRTLAGALRLRRLRAEHADVAVATTPELVGMAVALFGNAALLALMPQAARGCGLLDGGRWAGELGHTVDRPGAWTRTAMSELDHHNPTSPF